MRDVYEALHCGGERVITDWKLEGHQRAKLQQKIDMLRSAEVDVASGRVNLPSKLLAGPGVYEQPHIYKMLIHGNVQLRPMLCLGPISRETEWTFLARAVEKDDVQPKAEAATAAQRRTEILADPTRREILVAGSR